MRRFLFVCVFPLIAFLLPAQETRHPDVPYLPTPQPVVDAILKLAGVKSGDVLYDLGSGDGRIPITAARLHGIRAVGIEIDPKLIAEARANAVAAGVQNKVRFTEADLFTANFADATVITLYLKPALNLKLMPRLKSELRPGTRIVSHNFDMGDWKPDRRIEVEGRYLFLWTIK